jgi:hypothetical protein
MLLTRSFSNKTDVTDANAVLALKVWFGRDSETVTSSAFSYHVMDTEKKKLLCNPYTEEYSPWHIRLRVARSIASLMPMLYSYYKQNVQSEKEFCLLLNSADK